jgi:CBS domain-containing protein
MMNDDSQDSAAFEDPLSNYEPTEYKSELHRAFAEESVDAIESKPFVEVESSTPIRQAIEALYVAQVSSILVVDEERVVGIFTERDVLEKVAEQYSQLEGAPVSEVMTTKPMVVYETDPAATAVAAIAVAGHRHVPVLGINDGVLGVVSPRRVFDFMEKHFEA